MALFRSLFKGGKATGLLALGLFIGIAGWGSLMGFVAGIVGSIPMEVHLLAPLVGLAVAGYLIDEVMD